MTENRFRDIRKGMSGVLMQLRAPGGKRYVALDPEIDVVGNQVLVDKNADEAAIDATRRDFVLDQWGNRQEWMEGRIPANSSRNPALPYIFVCIALLALLIGYGIALTWGGGTWLLAVFLTVFAAVFGGISVRLIIQQRKYGSSQLTLAESPIAIGGRLLGEVLTGVPRTTRPRHGFKLVLRCLSITRTDSSGTGPREQRKTLWAGEASSQGQVLHAAKDYSVKVDMVVPGDQPGVTLGAGAERIAWELSIRTELPGIDYEETFVLPILKAAQCEWIGAPVKTP